MEKNKLSKSGSNITTKDGKVRVGLPRLHVAASQVEREVKSEANRAAEMPNRIALMLDCSGSMGGEKIHTLREATTGFIDSVNFDNTSCAIATFGKSNDQVSDLTCDSAMLKIVISSLDAQGGTPMHKCLGDTISQISITRGVVVSDGAATDWPRSPSNWDIEHDTDVTKEPQFPVGNLEGYIEMKIPVDCVHIGTDTNGEQLLEFIAKTTGGIFIKFKDIASFGRSLKYLSPRYRALLNAEGAASLLGATEVKR